MNMNNTISRKENGSFLSTLYTHMQDEDDRMYSPKEKLIHHYNT
jgi:hypothetical protein